MGTCSCTEFHESHEAAGNLCNHSRWCSGCQIPERNNLSIKIGLTSGFHCTDIGKLVFPSKLLFYMPDHQEIPTFCTRFRGNSCHVGSTDESRRTLSHGASRSKWKLDPLDGQMGKLLIQKDMNFCMLLCHKRFLRRCRTKLLAAQLLAAQRYLAPRCEMCLFELWFAVQSAFSFETLIKMEVGPFGRANVSERHEFLHTCHKRLHRCRTPTFLAAQCHLPRRCEMCLFKPWFVVFV